MGYEFRDYVDSQECVSVVDPFVQNVDAEHEGDLHDEQHQDREMVAAMQAAADAEKDLKTRRFG